MNICQNRLKLFSQIKNRFNCINNEPIFMLFFAFVVPNWTDRNAAKSETKTENGEINLNVVQQSIRSAPLFNFSTNLLRRQID